METLAALGPVIQELLMRFAKITLLFALALGLISFGCGPSDPPEAALEKAEVKEPPPPEPAEETAEEAAEEPEPVETAELKPPEPKPEPPAPKPKPKPKVEDTKPVVIMETSKGTIKIELNREKAPGTVDNFLQYVDDKFYDGTIFHRVMKGFMIQGGGFSPSMNEKRARATIKNESSNGLKNVRGTLAMARRPDPHSAGAQFFINHATSSFLDKDQARDGWGYCVFGKVIEGMDVVDEIAEVKTTTKGGHSDVPELAVVIKSVARTE